MSADTISLLNNPNIGNQPQVNTEMVPRGIDTTSVSEDSSQSGGSSDGSQGNKSLHEVVSQVAEFVQNMRRNLDFSVDQATGKTIIKVTDAETHEVIRQIPSEEFLQIAEALEKTKSLLSRSEA